MANRTAKDAKSIKGTNPQYLVEKIIRTRIYDSKYWKEECFGLTGERSSRPTSCHQSEILRVSLFNIISNETKVSNFKEGRVSGRTENYKTFVE